MVSRTPEISGTTHRPTRAAQYPKGIVRKGGAPALDAMLARRADGIIVGLMGAKKIDVPAIATGVRVVLLNASSPTGEPAILPDEEGAGRAIARQLLDAGHRRIALIGDLHSAATDLRVSVTVGARFAGLDAALAEAGIDFHERVTVEPWEPVGGYEAVQKMLNGPAVPTGIVCFNDRLALGVYQALQEAAPDRPRMRDGLRDT